MKSIIKTILSIFVVSSLVLSCDKWTQPQNLDFHRKTPQQLDPSGYEKYLEGIREYKKSTHKQMFVTMKAYKTHPSSQNQHLMAMPDSADFICVTMDGDEIYKSVADEIKQVHESKGTEVLLNVDYAPIYSEWSVLEDQRADEGRPAATDEEIVSFFKSKTQAQLENCSKYGFHGLQVTYVGNRSTHFYQLSQDTYISTIMEYYKSTPELRLVFRGSARNIVDKEFLAAISHVVIIAGEEKKLNVLVTRLGDAPTDRIIMEVTVPSTDNPEQVGRSAIEAAQWVLDEQENEKFTPLGLAVSNAYDDYFNKNSAFWNIRTAINTMNHSISKEESSEDEK